MQRLLKSCLVAICAFASVQVTSGTTYNVYLCSKHAAISDFRAHVWNRSVAGGVVTDTSFKEWDVRDRVTETLRYVVINGDKVPVFEYSFEWDNVPTHLNFSYKLKDTNVEKQTDNLEFVNGAYYSFDGLMTPQPVATYEYEPHTIYFVDRGNWGAANTLVHSWGDVGDHTAWADNRPMTDTGKLALVNGRYYPVYSYTYLYPGVPTHVLIHQANTSLSTGDQLFDEGGFYQCVVDEAGKFDGALDLYDDIPSITVYFADTDNWGAANTLVHAWGTAGDHTAWGDNLPMIETGRYININGNQWAPVYSYEIAYPGSLEGIMFHKRLSGLITCDLVPADGMCYVYNGDKAYFPPVKIDLDGLPTVPASESDPVTLILNLGANQLAENLWQQPSCHVWRRDATDNYDNAVPALGSAEYEAEKMTMVSPGVYTYTVDNPADANDVLFYYYSAGGTQAVFPASRSPHFDPTNWRTYVYDIGLDCVHQSYVLPEEYYAVINGSTHERLFLTGNSAVNPAFDNLDPGKNLALDQDEGIFVHKFTVGTGADNAITFKLSAFDPKGYATAAGAVDSKTVSGTGDKPAMPYRSQRAWASFNLGIIGCVTEQTEEWRKEHILEFDNGESRQVILAENSTMAYNYSTQYAWTIRSGKGDIEAGADYWLVVDSHHDDKSVTLLDFDPNPAITVKSVDMATLPLSPGQALELHDPMIAAGSHINGPVLFDYVNIVDGIAHIDAVGNELLGENAYSVVYTVYLDGNPMVRYEGVPDDVEVPFMTAGHDANIAVRARYTHHLTGRSFCSHYAKGTISSDVPELPVPSPSPKESVLVSYRKDGEGRKMMAMAAALDYGMPETNLAYFPDYELDATRVDDRDVDVVASLLHVNHPLITTTKFFNHTLVGWTPTDATDDYHPANNWSRQAAQDGMFPLVLDDIDLYEAGAITPRVEADFHVHALFPFLVLKPNTSVTDEAQQPALRRLASDIVIPADLSNYKINVGRTSAPVSVSASNKVMTGIEAVSVDAPGETTYYNLAGIRVDFLAASPGVYIERCGSVARKIVKK